MLIFSTSGELAEVRELLAELRARAGNRLGRSSSTQPAPRSWFHSEDPISSLAFEPEPYWREARRLDELIQANGDDPKYGVAPLAELARLDPQRPGYREQLLRLAQRYRDARLYDNLVVLWAASLTDRDERAARLEACIREFPDGDAVAEAMFHLAELEVQARGEDQDMRRQAGMARMTAVVERFGQTYWGHEAAERLRVLSPPAKPVPAPAVAP